MHSKRSLEGWLLLDNSAAGGGVSPELARRVGKPDLIGLRAEKVELPTLTCSHCQRQMIVQPLRTRERAYCRKCDHYICDECALVAHLDGGACVTLKTRLDRLAERAVKQPLILTKG